MPQKKVEVNDIAHLEIAQLRESLATGRLFANKGLDSGVRAGVDFQVSFLVEALVAARDAAVVSLPGLVSTIGGQLHLTKVNFVSITPCCWWSHLWRCGSRRLLLGLDRFHQNVDVGGKGHASERALDLANLEFVRAAIGVGLVRVYRRLRFRLHGIERRQGVSGLPDVWHGGWQLGWRAGISCRGLDRGSVADAVVLWHGILAHAREIKSVSSGGERDHARSGGGRKHVHGELDMVRLLERPCGWRGCGRHHRGHAH